MWKVGVSFVTIFRFIILLMHIQIYSSETSRIRQPIKTGSLLEFKDVCLPAGTQLRRFAQKNNKDQEETKKQPKINK